jgi:hypothetical protein
VTLTARNRSKTKIFNPINIKKNANEITWAPNHFLAVLNVALYLLDTMTYFTKLYLRPHIFVKVRKEIGRGEKTPCLSPAPLVRAASGAAPR